MKEMHARGLDFCLDVHGDEALPYNFISGSEGVPCWSERLATLQKEWCDAYQQANPDFQQIHGALLGLSRPRLSLSLSLSI